MALSRVQATPKATADSQSSVAATFTTAPANGNGIVVGVMSSYGGDAGLPADACTDNRGNTYTKATGGGFFIGPTSVTIYYCPKITATGSPFTITISPAVGSVDFVACAVEVGGVGGGLTVDPNGTGTIGIAIGTTAQPPLGTFLVTTDVFSMAVLAVAASQASITVSAFEGGSPPGVSPGWVQEIQELSLGPYIAGEIDTRLVHDWPALTQQSCQWVFTATGWFAAGKAAFAATPGEPEPEPEEETLFDPDEAAIVGLTWVEFTDSDNVLHVWAGIALPDPLTYYGGYKAPSIIDWDPILRGLSNIDGAYEGIRWGWLMSDTDRAIRRMLANELTKWFFNRNVVGRTITDPGRRALETPRTIFRGVVREWQPGAQGIFSFSAEDYLVTTFQIGTDEQQCPKRKIVAADFPTCPEENFGRPVPIIYGNLSDKAEVVHIVPGVDGVASTVGLKKPTGLTATVHGGAGTSSYTYAVTALDNRNKQYNVYSKRRDHAGETDAAYVTVTNAPSLSQMSATRYVELNWTDSVGAYFYRIYGRAVNGGTSLNLLDSARGPKAGTPERYNDGMRHGYVEVDREKTDSHPPATNNTIVDGSPDVPETSYVTDTGHGIVPVVHVGQREIGGEPWYEFLVCGHAIKAIVGVYQADVEASDTGPQSEASRPEPAQQNVVPIDPSLETDAGVKSVAPITALGGIRIPDNQCDAGGDLLVPTLGTGWAAAIGAPVYVDYNGHRYTVIYARGSKGEKAALGEQPLFLNVDGIETTGDGTGTLLTSLIDQYLHVMQNWLIGDYQTGAWLPSPVFPDEALPQIDATSFAKAKGISEQRIPGGYVGAIQFGLDGTFFSVRDAIAQMNVSCDVNSGFNYRTQFIVSMQSEEISSLGAAQAVTQIRDIIRDTFNIESLVSEFFNRIPFMYGLLPENNTHIFYSEVKDPTSIAASLETRSSQTRDLPFVRNAPIAFDIARRFLMRSKEVPRRVTWDMGMSGLNFELGDIVLVTHLDGIGLNGYEATPIRVTRQDYNPQNYTVSIEGYDVGQFFSDAFILGNESALSASWATATLAERKYGYLGDETTGAFNDGARAKRLR